MYYDVMCFETASYQCLYASEDIARGVLARGDEFGCVGEPMLKNVRISNVGSVGDKIIQSVEEGVKAAETYRQQQQKENFDLDSESD